METVTLKPGMVMIASLETPHRGKAMLDAASGEACRGICLHGHGILNSSLPQKSVHSPR